jgi:hypothetical protein
MPCATLVLEDIGNDLHSMMRLAKAKADAVVPGLGDAVFGSMPRRAWVAEISGHDARYGYRRQFVRGKTDLLRSNSRGSRGVYLYFVLHPGRLYEVCSPQSWRRHDRYFCEVSDDGMVTRITDSEVGQWIKSRLA